MICKVSNEICNVCALSKSSRLPFHINVTKRSNRRLQLVHSDICGPISPATYDNYFMITIFCYVSRRFYPLLICIFDETKKRLL